jgi:predicted dehydrogenase
VRNLNEVPGGSRVVVANLDPDQLAPLAQQDPGIVTANHHETLTDPSIDAVCMATLISTHPVSR